MSGKKTSSWLIALREWNEGQSQWCIPAKGTNEYEEVMVIKNKYKKLNNPKAPKAKKPKKKLKIMD